MLNKVILMGRLTRDPEPKATPSGVSMCTFSLAVDRDFVRNGEERQTDFINIIVFGPRADFAIRYFRKGQLVAVCGRIQTRNWDDNEGKRHYATEVLAEELHFAESKKDNGDLNQGYQGGYNQAQPAYNKPNNYQPEGSDYNNAPSGFSANVDDDDLPF